MKHGQVSRNYAKAVLALVTLGFAGACADTSTVAPTATEAAAFKAPANFQQVGNVVVFRVNNAEGITKRIGDHLINIPAGAICDLSSGYGTTEWDKACKPLKGSVVITATVLQDGDGMPYIDFQPAMRFAPTKEVMLFMRQGKNSKKAVLWIEYCDNLGKCVDESLTDSSLKPFRVGRTNILGRRVKHFSGYTVTSGANCPVGWTVTDLGDGTFWCDDNGSFSRRSGYMVASGESVEDVMKDKDAKDEKGDEKDEQQ